MISAPDLALYHYEGCGYCARVRRALDRLGVEVELRDVDEVQEFETDLFQARGQRTVPVLRIQHEDGRVEWMGESRNIVGYLEKRFA